MRGSVIALPPRGAAGTGRLKGGFGQDCPPSNLRGNTRQGGSSDDLRAANLARQQIQAEAADGQQGYPAAPDGGLLAMHAEEDRARAAMHGLFEQRGPDGADQVAEVQQVAPLCAHDAVDGAAESGGHEENAEEQAAGHGLPLYPGREGQGQQREEQNPDPRAEEERAGDAQVLAEPAVAFQRRLQNEEQQAGNPSHDGHQNQQHGELAEHVLGAREGPREIQRQRVVGEVRRDLSGSYEGREEERHHALPAEEVHKEAGVDFDQVADLQHLQGAEIVLNINDEREDERRQHGNQEEYAVEEIGRAHV